MLVVLLCCALGVVQLRADVGSGVAFLVAGALFAYGHFRYGPVWLALRAARAGDIDRAATLLGQVRRPAMLSRESSAYYHLTQAVIMLARCEPAEAERALHGALSLGLRTRNDRAVAHLLLAEVLLARSARIEAEAQLDIVDAVAKKPGLLERARALRASLAVRS